MAYRLTPAFQRQVLADALTSVTSGDFTGAIVGLKLGLSTQALPETGDVSYADDVVSPDYSGYADQAVTWGAVFRDDDGAFKCQGSTHVFQEASTLSSNTIRATFLYKTGTPNVIYATENMGSTKLLATADDAFILVPEIGVATGDVGGAVVLS